MSCFDFGLGERTEKMSIIDIFWELWIAPR